MQLGEQYVKPEYQMKRSRGGVVEGYGMTGMLARRQSGMIKTSYDRWSQPDICLIQEERGKTVGEKPTTVGGFHQLHITILPSPDQHLSATKPTRPGRETHQLWFDHHDHPSNPYLDHLHLDLMNLYLLRFLGKNFYRHLMILLHTNQRNHTSQTWLRNHHPRPQLTLRSAIPSGRRRISRMVNQCDQYFYQIGYGSPSWT
jgi:hypothetical protein